MANKVITFNSTWEKPNKDPEAKYIDLSMYSPPYRRAVTRFDDTKTFKIEQLRDVTSIQNAMHNLFTWIPGQRILDPEFGNTVRKYIFEGNTNMTADNVRAEIQIMVDKYEPRVEIDEIGYDNGEENKDNNELDLKVIYHAKGFPDKKYSVSILL